MDTRRCPQLTSGVFVKNIALCFDRARERSGSTDATNAATLAELLVADDSQLVWSCPHAVGGRSRLGSGPAPLDSARTCVAAAYGVLVEHWSPGDRLFLFGSGRGAACARALARLLGTVGVLRGPDVPGWTASDFRQYVLATYAMPRTCRTPADWRRVGELAAQISGRDDVSVDVAFLGLWDTAAIPGLPRPRTPDPLPHVGAVRHAVAIDAGSVPLRAQPPRPASDQDLSNVDEVWFRGTHADVAGGRHACEPLADIALDWMIDGALRAGIELTPSARSRIPAPGTAEALAGHTHLVPVRRVPPAAAVHASVATYVRAHPAYWRRLPSRIVWADPDWAARAERLIDPAPAPTRELVGAG
ncbi:MAG: DUF2235 domain-containing protein [Actinomycetota bacterium]|nr:DUF2235 domain-containing protein [Actinomycetota bacterium]